MRRYHLQKRSDYQSYARIVGQITKLANKLSLLPPNSAVRKDLADKLVEKVYAMGIVPVKTGLSVCEKISVSAFCRRRLAIVMMRLRMSETIKEAVTLIEQGYLLFWLIL
jgi:U3 small nucleolar ribonucleoprotein protein IMP3